MTSPVTSSRPKEVIRLNLVKCQCLQIPYHQRNKQERHFAPALEHADRVHPSLLSPEILGKIKKIFSKSFELRNDLALQNICGPSTSIQTNLLLKLTAFEDIQHLSWTFFLYIGVALFSACSQEALIYHSQKDLCLLGTNLASSGLSNEDRQLDNWN